MQELDARCTSIQNGDKSFSRNLDVSIEDEEVLDSQRKAGETKLTQHRDKILHNS
jgi:hypothetical protein